MYVYILVITLVSSSSNGGRAVMAVEFGSASACKVAAAELMENKAVTNAFCFAKY